MDSTVFGGFLKDEVVLQLKTGETYTGKIKQYFPEHIIFETDTETQVWQVEQIISLRKKK